jgi:hypothetical protein
MYTCGGTHIESDRPMHTIEEALEQHYPLMDKKMRAKFCEILTEVNTNTNGLFYACWGKQFGKIGVNADKIGENGGVFNHTKMSDTFSESSLGNKCNVVIPDKCDGIDNMSAIFSLYNLADHDLHEVFRTAFTFKQFLMMFKDTYNIHDDIFNWRVFVFLSVYLRKNITIYDFDTREIGFYKPKNANDINKSAEITLIKNGKKYYPLVNN